MYVNMLRGRGGANLHDAESVCQDLVHLDLLLVIAVEHSQARNSTRYQLHSQLHSSQHGVW